AEIPEGEGNNAAAFHFAAEPLHQEARREQRLPRKAEHQPDAVGCHRRQQMSRHTQISLGSTRPRNRRISQATPRRSGIPTIRRPQFVYLDEPCARGLSFTSMSFT